MMEYIKLTMDNLATEHICCAIAEKKGSIVQLIRKHGLKNV